MQRIVKITFLSQQAVCRLSGSLAAKTLVFLLLTLLWQSHGQAESISIIVPESEEISQMSKEEVADRFLLRGLYSIPDLLPLDREEETLKRFLYLQVAGMSPNRLRAYWSKRVFTGRGRPPRSISKMKIEELPGEQSRVITYVRTGHVPTGMKVVLEIALESQQ